jgi:hypothetical protein
LCRKGVINIKRYIVSLTENVSDQVLTDFDYFGAKIIWASKLMPNLVGIETDKTKEELEQFFLVESADEERIGTLNC